MFTPKASAKPKKLCILTICTRSFIRILTASSVPSVSMDALCRSCQDLPEQEAGLVGCCIPVALGVDDNPSTVAYILNNNNNNNSNNNNSNNIIIITIIIMIMIIIIVIIIIIIIIIFIIFIIIIIIIIIIIPVALGLLSLTMFNIFSHVSVAPPSIWTFYAHMTSVGTRRNG